MLRYWWRIVRRFYVTLVLACCLATRVVGLADDPPREQPAISPMPLDVATALSGLTPAQFADMVRSAQKSVVVVTFAGRDRREQGLGSGFILRADGLIATNLHVIGEARPINVRLHDGRSFPVTEIVATSKSQDLAILRIATADLPALPLASPEMPLQQGQPVFAIGNPQGLEHSVVTGIVSGFRDDDGMSLIQLAIPIERGNSGGPLLDMQGNVHGLLTLKSQVTENLGYAVQANALTPLLEQPHPIPMSRWITIGRLNPRYWKYDEEVQWMQRAGRIRVAGTGSEFGGRAICLWHADPPAVPFELGVRVKIEEEDGAAGIVFHATGDTHYGFYPSSGKLRFTRFDGPTVYDWHVLQETRSAHLNSEEWNDLKVRIEPGRFLCYCNEELIFDISDDEYTSGKVGLAKFRHTTVEFRDFQVAQTIPGDKPSAEFMETLRDTANALPLDRPVGVDDAKSLGELLVLNFDGFEHYAAEMELRAQRVRELGAALRQQRLRQQLLGVLQDKGELGESSIDLAHAAILLAAIDNSEVDVQHSLQAVADLAQDFLQTLPAGASGEEKVEAYHRFLFQEQGFHGSRTNYYHASNSFLNEVIDDREGIPITLSVLYMEVARRAGIKTEGVGLPGHFIVRTYIEGAQPRLVDVFDGGATLTKADCQKMLLESRQLPWQDEFLDAQTPRDIVIRMVRNLLGIANSDQDAEAALRYVETVLTLDPDSAEDHLLKAVICYSSGRIESGLAEVDWILENRPPEVDLERILQLKTSLQELKR